MSDMYRHMLKVFLLVALLASPAFGDSIQPGRYVPLSGNPGFYRIHDVRPEMDGSRMKAIRVTYSNDHYSDGPIRYECSEIWGDLICKKNATLFVIRDSAHYLFHDKLYGNLAEFALKP